MMFVALGLRPLEISKLCGENVSLMLHSPNQRRGCRGLTFGENVVGIGLKQAESKLCREMYLCLLC